MGHPIVFIFPPYMRSPVSGEWLFPPSTRRIHHWQGKKIIKDSPSKVGIADTDKPSTST